MTEEVVTEQLKEIGPYVTYDKDVSIEGITLHKWVVSEKPFGPGGKTAVLAMVDEIKPLSDEDMNLGRQRYETSIERNNITTA